MSQNVKKSSHFTINFIDRQIIGSRASLNKAGKGYGAEYAELTAKMTSHPDFAIVVAEPKHKATKAKRTYNGLDFPFMEAYIATCPNADAVLADYKAVKKKAEDCGTRAYPLTKKWFLNQFSTEAKPFDMNEAREAISNFRIASATNVA